MAKAKTSYKMQFRRRLEQKTNYKKRLALLKSGKARLVIRKTNRQVIVQLISFKEIGDITHVYVGKKQLEKYGWKMKANAPSAYLAGYLAGKLALKAGIKSAVVDIGMHSPTEGAIVFFAAKGARDAGLDIPFAAQLDEQREKGKHINMEAEFEQTKKKIEGIA